MAKEFKLQDPGEGIHEAEILDVAVSEGDDVSEGDILLTVETDKAAVEVPAPFSGTIDEILVGSGDQARVGDVLIRYSERSANGRPDAAGSSERETDAGDEDAQEKQKGQKGKSKGEGKGDKNTKKKDKKKKKKKDKAAQAKRRSEQQDRETAADDGEGEEARAERPQARARDDAERDGGRGKGPVPAAPTTRRLARELGVDLRSVDASGPGGRVMDKDVRAAAEGGKRPEKTGTAPAAEREPAEDGFGRWGAIERVEFRGVRRATARVMTRAWSEIPHVMHQENADITALDEMREDHKAAVEKHGGKLTLTPFVIKAAVAALKEFPRFNASLSANGDDQHIVLKRYYHIGVAVATERGLVVPVLRDADRKSLADIAVELTHLADRARNGDLAPDDMQGGTFTITNPGGIGGDSFTPIINHPEVAILGMGAARLTPVVQGSLRDAAIVPRLQLPLCLAFDHRINDGADAARFMRRVVEILRDPQYLTLHV